MSCETSEEVRRRLDDFEASLRRAAGRAGRTAEEIRVVAVSKTVPAERVRAVFNLGYTEFGENRVQELLAKKSELPESVRWHMIGHLQTNKVRQVLGQTVLIHSVDRIDLVREIERQAEKQARDRVDGLIQVNSSGEATKSGVEPERAAELVAAIGPGSPLRIRGLMTIGPLTEDSGRIRACFRSLRKMRDDFRRLFPEKDWEILSMGMSSDYEIAVEEGASLLRIGSVIFGERT
jgi:pyridoxal phosphate enzyme (YggS family)